MFHSLVVALPRYRDVAIYTDGRAAIISRSIAEEFDLDGEQDSETAKSRNRPGKPETRRVRKALV
ncbi:MAG: hypothetical protein KC432_09745 [Thermomicrobiales bacterium]|nr:hypothetical protein [Thermomicrobiales bacterium]